MQRAFSKMHGIGNDYIYFDCFSLPFPKPEEAAVKLSNRHFSVGGDGIVLILKSGVADAKMRMFNADGSEGKMCGNAIRCVGKFLYERKGIKKDVLTVETLSGVKTLRLSVREGEVRSVTVDMGAPVLAPEKIPALFAGETALRRSLSVGGKTYGVNCLSMGNPHCVVFGEDPDLIDLEQIGPLFENHSVFPERVNTEFAEVLSERELKVRVWERGSGETLACGTGACATAVAAVLNGYCREGEDIAVRLKGGELRIRYTGGTVFMTGPAAFSFEGTVEL